MCSCTLNNIKIYASIVCYVSKETKHDELNI